MKGDQGSEGQNPEELPISDILIWPENDLALFVED